MLTSDFMLTFAALNKSNNQKKKNEKIIWNPCSISIFIRFLW